MIFIASAIDVLVRLLPAIKQDNVFENGYRFANVAIASLDLPKLSSASFFCAEATDDFIVFAVPPAHERVPSGSSFDL